jgi:uncharacterized membrane protein (DUF485 family)
MNIIDKIVVAIFFLLFLRGAWSFFKGLYVMNARFCPYMELHHAGEWAEINKNFAGFPWKVYDSRVVLYFIWISNETFGDENINVFRRKIKNLMKESILFGGGVLLLAFVVTFLAVWLNGPNPAFVSPGIK